MCLCICLPLCECVFASSSSINDPWPQSWALLSFLVHLGCLVVSIVRPTLTWPSGSLTCICNLFACLCTMGTVVYCLIRSTFVESALNLTLEKSQGRHKA